MSPSTGFKHHLLSRIHTWPIFRDVSNYWILHCFFMRYRIVVVTLFTYACSVPGRSFSRQLRVGIIDCSGESVTHAIRGRIPQDQPLMERDTCVANLTWRSVGCRFV